MVQFGHQRPTSSLPRRVPKKSPLDTIQFVLWAAKQHQLYNSLVNCRQSQQEPQALKKPVCQRWREKVRRRRAGSSPSVSAVRKTNWNVSSGATIQINEVGNSEIWGIQKIEKMFYTGRSKSMLIATNYLEKRRSRKTSCTKENRKWTNIY